MSDAKDTPKRSSTTVAKKTVTARKPAVRKTTTVKAATTTKKPIVRANVKRPVAAIERLQKVKKTTKKEKLVRDSFSMPEQDYAKISELKALCLKVGIKAKKNELLRAGLNALSKLNGAQLKQALASLDAIKTTQVKKK